MHLRLFAIAICTAILWPLSDALAAPQLLGVVATAEPISMTCAEGDCTVELSAFCLERDRAMPQDGMPYQLLDPSKITLVITNEDGETHRVAAAPYVRIASERNFYAVKLSLAESSARELGAAHLAVAVAPQLILVPQAAANDPQPITEEEVAKVRDLRRGIAASFFDQDSRDMAEVRIMNRLINALPIEDRVDLATSGTIWRKVVGEAYQLDQQDPVIAEVASFYSSCRLGTNNPWPPTLRRCLQMSHDAIMGGINAQYWRAADTGS